MSPAVIPPAIAPRIGALLRMLGSPIDGEALGAARALRRTLDGAGLDLHALADVVEHPVPAVILRESAQPQPAARGSRKARQPSPGSVELQPARRRQVVDALVKATARGSLSSWEAEFAASVITTLRGSRPRLSARQFEIVERLLSKFGESRF